MKTATKTRINGAILVKKLRTEKLQSGLPFMIHSKELASGQCYYEYPNGKIELVEIADSKDISTLKTLSQSEADRLRKKLNLDLVN
ncbi:MAG: hypothetical protein QM564_12595 [Bergeyella sp.]